jgi:endonuclease YncB( thermonuclease family)
MYAIPLVALALVAGAIHPTHGVLTRALPGIGDAAGTSVTVDRRLGPCAPGRASCVIDGDTIRLDDQSIRLADINAPETRGARCARERALGDRATRRLRQLINAGPFALVRPTFGRDADAYGRKLRRLERAGRSLGDVLVAEGLARPWTGRRRSWCG